MKCMGYSGLWNSGKEIDRGINVNLHLLWNVEYLLAFLARKGSGMNYTTLAYSMSTWKDIWVTIRYEYGMKTWFFSEIIGKVRELFYWNTLTGQNMHKYLPNCTKYSKKPTHLSDRIPFYSSNISESLSPKHWQSIAEYRVTFCMFLFGMISIIF